MALILYTYAGLQRRMSHLMRPENRDAGDGPVPTVIIIAGLALLAMAVLAWAVGLADDFMGTDVGELPESTH